MNQGINEMRQHFVFQTADPACIRHAGRDRERLSQQHPTSGSQRKAEAEQQRYLHVLAKAGGSNGKKLAEKLQTCRNDSPCGSAACAHCLRERYLGHLDVLLPMMSASRRYSCVELVFNEDAAVHHPGLDKPQYSAQIERYKQRISRTMSRLGFSGPAIGTFSLLRHRFNGAEESTFWLPRLRLLLPDNRNLLDGIRAHMTRGVMDSVGTGRIIPVRKMPAGSKARTLGLVLDPREYVIACRKEESQGMLKTCNLELLKGGTLARSLVMMDSMGFSMLTFKYGMLHLKSSVVPG